MFDDLFLEQQYGRLAICAQDNAPIPQGIEIRCKHVDNPWIVCDPLVDATMRECHACPMVPHHYDGIILFSGLPKKHVISGYMGHLLLLGVLFHEFEYLDGEDQGEEPVAK